MTKLVESDMLVLRDRPNSNEALQPVERLNGSGVQVFKHRDDVLPFKGLPVAEAYLEGRLVVCAIFWNPVDLNGVMVTVRYEGNAENPATAGELQLFNECALLGGQQDHVLVSDVEDVKLEEVFALPSRERLYLFEDELDDLRAGSMARFGMSVDGTLKVLPRAVFCEGEPDVTVDRAAIGFDEDTVSVFKGGPEIVQRIAENCGRMPGKLAANDSRFPRLTIILGDHSLFVAVDVGAENVFQLKDVVFGPFSL